MLTSHIIQLTSCLFPDKVLIKAKLMNPNAKPLAILEVSGIIMIVRNAGRPSVKS